jgi:hypothetical protein
MSRGKKKRIWQRAGKFNQHHLRPSSRGGQTISSNLIRMDINRHDAWHLLFNNLTLTEIIEILTRLKNIKKKQAKTIKL